MTKVTVKELEHGLSPADALSPGQIPVLPPLPFRGGPAHGVSVLESFGEMNVNRDFRPPPRWGLNE